MRHRQVCQSAADVTTTHVNAVADRCTNTVVFRVYVRFESNVDPRTQRISPKISVRVDWIRSGCVARLVKSNSFQVMPLLKLDKTCCGPDLRQSKLLMQHLVEQGSGKKPTGKCALLCILTGRVA